MWKVVQKCSATACGMWLRLVACAHLLAFGGASQLRTNFTRGEPVFVFDYLKHGQDWMQGSCSSRSRQSPIDFPDMTQIPDPANVFAFAYHPVYDALSLSNNGHAYSMDLSGLGYGGLSYDGAWYNLLIINVHAKSEHTFVGRHLPVELHLVHKRYDSDALLVVALMVDCSGKLPGMPPPGSFLQGAQPSSYTAPPTTDLNFNKNLQFFLKQPPPQVNMEIVVPPAQGDPLDLNAWMEGGTFFDYSGSLTAPPCAETVSWLVRREPIMASDTQVMFLYAAAMSLTAGSGNYRDTMPLNGRMTLVRKAVPDEALPSMSNQVTPGVTNPKTGREERAEKWAKDALGIAKASVDYVKDLDARLRAADAAQAAALKTPPAPAPASMGPSPALRSAAGAIGTSGAAANTAKIMAASIEQAAKEAIAGATAAAREAIEVEARKAALAAASDAAQLVMNNSGVPRIPGQPPI